ncbi:MAG TPA: hypothetical protein DEG96_09960 [Candidatus Atribacteria bacterium]|uniref:Glycosyl transferase, family 2 n=1 Tax=candidate division TA06 bacterium 34_109 TaxID=1635277 RepID=A0A117M5X7_UNCT6|nr:MAG: Glycosyl transferase, family 2 [candidate division TA06 bacterium 34_109]HBY58158.1 hypothetical protein [Candidatus Atribacteria bacterium]
MNSPKISICIPTYNRAKFIREAIDSVLKQTFRDFELIVVDNCSTDNTQEIVKAFDDGRLRYVCNERNLGVIGNYNKCISLARGDYICIIHSDDMLLPRFLEVQSAILDKNSDVGLVHSNCSYIDEQGVAFSQSIFPSTDYIKDGEEEMKDLVLDNHIVMSAAIVRKSCYDLLGGYNEKIPWVSDWEMWLRICLKWKIAYIGKVLCLYRRHQMSGTTGIINLNLAGMEEYKMFKEFWEYLLPEKKHLSYLEPIAIKQTAKRMLWRAWNTIQNGQTRLARRNIALGIAIDDSLLRDFRVYALFLLSLLGKPGLMIGRWGAKVLTFFKHKGN